MMSIEKVYLDMDGVLVDFDAGVAKMCGFNNVPQGQGNPGDDDRLWDAVRQIEHFYDKLEPLPGAVAMFHSLYDHYGANLEILTAIPQPRRQIMMADQDKICWVRRMLSDAVKVNVVLRKQKVDFCHGCSDVLIDDYPKNICEWEERGGIGIIHQSISQTMSRLRELENS